MINLQQTMDFFKKHSAYGMPIWRQKPRPTLKSYASKIQASLLRYVEDNKANASKKRGMNVKTKRDAEAIMG